MNTKFLCSRQKPILKFHYVEMTHFWTRPQITDAEWADSGIRLEVAVKIHLNLCLTALRFSL